MKQFAVGASILGLCFGIGYYIFTTTSVDSFQKIVLLTGILAGIYLFVVLSWMLGTIVLYELKKRQ